MAEYTLISYAFGGLSFVRPLSDLILQYILGSCTWYGLSTIGEPPLTKSLVGGGQNSSSIMDPIAARKQVENSQVPMPGWLIIIFFALGATRYIGSFLVSPDQHVQYPIRKANELVFICVPSNCSCRHGLVG